MASGGWREFRYGDVRVDILEGRFLRLRSREYDRDGLRAYLVIDAHALQAIAVELYEGGSLVSQEEPGAPARPKRAR